MSIVLRLGGGEQSGIFVEPAAVDSIFFFFFFFNLYTISSQFEPAVHVRLPVALVCQHVPTREGVLKIIYKFERSELDAILWLVVCSNLNVLLYQNNFLRTLL